MNIGGNRIGTEEIENVLLSDSDASPLKNCVVVGFPDDALGSVPIAFVVLKPGVQELSSAATRKLRSLVKMRLSSTALPKEFLVVPDIPETYSGKFMRGLLKNLLVGISPNNLGAVKNPGCMKALEEITREFSTPNQLAEREEAVGTRQSQLLALVLEVLYKVTGVDDVQSEMPLMEAGVDSMMSLHFVTELQHATGLVLSSTLIFEHSTASSVAQHLAARLGSFTVQEGLTTSPKPFVQRNSPSVSSGSGHWPKNCSTHAALWCFCRGSFDSVDEVLSARWLEGDSGDSFMSTHRARYLGSLHNAELFDFARFSVSYSEALWMDPQQRLLLETAYEALGVSPQKLQEEIVSVAVGITNTDFLSLLAVSSSVYAATGGAISIAAGRISYVLGLHGPCKSIDTACSSAIVALDDAGSSLNFGDSTFSLALAACLILSPTLSLAYSLAGMLSEDGRCKTFDTRANGYVRAEGVGGVMLSHLIAEEAKLLYQVVMQDGKSASLTAPSGAAQASLLTRARSFLERGESCSFESHGTGTPLGNP